MKSPDCKSCMYACKNACAKPCSASPRLGNCTIIKRCTSPKPSPIPGCKWVKKCSPSLGGGIVSPVFMRRRHHRVSPFIYGHRRRHHYPRRISPYATTVIGHGRRSPIRRVSVSPVSTVRRGVVSPGRRVASPTIRRFRK